MAKKTKPLSLTIALLPLATMLLSFVALGSVMALGAELLILVMLAAAGVAGAIALKVGYGWDEIQRSAGERLAAVLPAVLILLAIGVLIGTWVLSGTIPALIYYGIQLVNPKFIVLTAFLVTAVMSVCTGTSWGSAGTMGVALMGIASAIGAPIAATAGAVVSGAYFGDKLSPLSDSTNICAIGAGANLYAHIRHLLYTSVPAFIVAAIVYALIGDWSSGTLDYGSEQATVLLAEIEKVYQLSWLVFIPLLVVLVGMLLKKPPALTMVASSLVAMAIGVGLQGFPLEDALVSSIRGFEAGMLESLGILPTDVSSAFLRLLTRGGAYSMSNTLILILAAFLLAAGLEVSGALDRILSAALRAVRSTFGLIGATMVSGTTMVSLTSHTGVTALIVGGLFQDAYKRRGLAPENLSRALEDSVTIVEPLVPWTVSALFMATTLGVATIDYLPWAIFCFSGPICSLLYAASFDRLGFGLKKLEPT